MARLIYSRLTDEKIIQLSQNRVITSDKDFNLKRNSKYEKNRLYPVVGGVYDSTFFGSIYTDTCNCGRIDTVGVICQKCGSKVLTEEEKYKRYARIDLDFYYLLDTKLLGMMQLLTELPLDFTKASQFFEFSRLSQSSTPRICELCEFTWNEATGEIIVDPEVKDESRASFEGLEKILNEHFPDKIEEFRSLVNKKVLVTPAVYRLATFNPFDPMSKLSIPFLSSIFQSIVRLKMLINERLQEVFDPSERTALKGSLRRYCAQIPDWVSEALLPSKINLLRGLYSARIDNSGRAPIIGDTSLKLDEVKIPIHLAYEMLKVDFIGYLSEKLGISVEKAELKYRQAGKEVLDLFRKYTPTRRVLVNRPPSLHRYNVMAFKMLVTEDYALHYPQVAVEPMAADYDGDAMSFYLVPENLNELVDANASPATQLRYESTSDFIWQPNQEMLYGITMATTIPSVSEDAFDSIPKYLALADAEADYESQKIQYPTDPIFMNGKLTTYAREKVSDIIRTPVSDLYENSYIDATNVHILLTYLYNLKDFTTVYQKLVEFALEVVTIEGATVPSLADMIALDTSKFDEEMKELIEKSKEDPRFAGKLEDKYKQYIKEQMDKLPEDMLRRVKFSGRIKIQQIADMMIPQLTVDANGEYYIATNSLVNGLSEKDMRRHAQNNRSLLQQKQELTPASGYTNRQLIMSGQGIQMNDRLSDPENEGVWIPRNRAEGRTTLDGEILGQSDSKELVCVRSFAVSKNKYMSPDLVSQTYNKFDNGSNVGLKMISAIAGNVTQKALSLKHVGVLSTLDQTAKLIAKQDCTVRKMSSDLIEITYKDGTKFNHYVPEGFLLSTDEEIKKGTPIGFLQKFVGPGFDTENLMDLIGATSTLDIENPREVDYCLCVTPVGGKIHYDQNYVYFDSFRLPRDPRRVYYWMEGEVVPKYSIICNGVLSMRNIREYCNNNQDFYGCFRTAFLKIMPKINEQTVEYLFSSVTAREGNDLTFVGVKGKVSEDKSLITAMSYEGTSKLIRTALTSPEIIEEDMEGTDLFNHFFISTLKDNL